MTATDGRDAANLAKLVLEQIELHPDTHDQLTWFEWKPEVWKRVSTYPWPEEAIIPLTRCMTTACVAGWACALSGDRADLNGVPEQRPETVETQENRVESIGDRARYLLGLTVEEADWLFAAARAQDDVRAALRLLADGQTIRSLLPRPLP